MSLNARQIEVFRAIMITGSISAASRLLHVSQPAISRVLAYWSSASAIRCSSGSNARFRSKHDQVKVTFQALTLPSLLDALIQQRAELGLSMTPVEHPNIDSTPLCHGTVVCVFPSGHALAKLDIVSVADLVAHPLVSYPHGTPFGNVVESIFAAAEIAKPVAVEVVSPQEACSIVAAGGGVAFVDTFSMNSRLGHGVDSRPIHDSPLLTANLLRLRQEPLSRLAGAFCETLRDVTAEFGFRPADEFSSVAINAIAM